MPSRPRDPAISLRQGLTVMRGSALGRDLFILVLGALGIVAAAEHEPPASLTAIGVVGPAAIMWATGFLVGALLSIIGSTWPGVAGGRGDEIQAAGCGIVGASFAIWTVAIIARSDTTLTSWMVLCVLAAGVFGQAYRVAVVAVGITRLIRLLSRQEARRCTGDQE